MSKANFKGFYIKVTKFTLKSKETKTWYVERLTYDNKSTYSVSAVYTTDKKSKAHVFEFSDTKWHYPSIAMQINEIRKMYGVRTGYFYDIYLEMIKND